MQKEITWLVTPIEGQKFIDSLTIACRGNVNEAAVMHYFLYEAACEADRNKIDPSTVEYITVERTLDNIINGLKRLNKDVSKKTLIARITKLQSYNFLRADGYRHTYDVHFNAVKEAFQNPPEPEQPKLRGRHAHRDCSFNNAVKTTISEVKTTIHTPEDAEEIVVLRNQIVNLQSQIVDLSQEIVNLQSQIVNLQSYNSSRQAWEADLTAKVDALYKLSNINLVTTYNTNSLTTSAASADAPVESEEENKVIDLASRKTVQQPQKTTRSKKAVTSIQLTLPDLDAAPTLETILQAGDYIRGYKLPQKDMKVCREGATALLQQKRPLRDIVKVLVFMSRRDDIRAEFGMKFKDEGYTENKKYKDADLSNIYNKMDIKLEEIARLEQASNKPAQDEQQSAPAPVAPVEKKPLTDEEKLQRRIANFIRDHSDKPVFWTTSGNKSTRYSNKLEELETWEWMSVEDAVKKYGMRPNTGDFLPDAERTGIQSKVTTLRKQVATAAAM